MRSRYRERSGNEISAAAGVHHTGYTRTERDHRALLPESERRVCSACSRASRRRAGRSPRGSAGIRRRARIRPWAIGAHANIGRNKVNGWWLDFGGSTTTCPTLVCEAKGDHFFAGQPQMLYDALTCPKTFMQFPAEDGAEEHCYYGALLLFNHRVFEWLDTTLQREASRSADG